MLYVFHVDMGRMLKFDMNVALSSVSNLKDTIERLHGIPAQNIVLLVSGGEMLTKSTQVSFYSAGTDTNPIYMFLMGDVKLTSTIPSIESEIDLKEQVDHSLTLPAVYETVVTRAQLAQQMYDLAREEEALCERLVHEQHLQQQGWSAVVANMEDLTEEFRQRFRNFCLSFDHHLEKREEYIELLNSFDDDLSKLSRIPILPGLMQMAQEDFHGFDAFLDNDDVFSRSQQNVSVVLAGGSKEVVHTASNSDNLMRSQDDDKRENTSPNKKLKMGSDDEKCGTDQSLTSIENGNRDSRTRTLTLLQWISAKENHNKLTEMSEECKQSLNAFNDIVYAKLKEEVNNVIKSADQSDMKEVKGLSDRLCKLEEIKYKIKNMVQDQKELSTAFQQNQNRAINLRDASILPDLCASHKSQLLVMLQNHQKIHDLRRCIAKAKDELGANLHTRLKRIVLLENKMSEFDNRQLFYHRCLKRAERHINIIEQIHQAPCIYVAAVTEVVRRKIFSGEFRQWASKLAEDFDTIHSEEINRRRNFNTNFEGHFLNILFPGMNDMPPAFANENPLIFDTRLPNITERDIDVLTTYLPDLTHHIQLPDMAPVINFFISRSGNQNINEKNLGSNKMLTSGVCPANVHHQRVLDLQTQFKEGCDESETDTEEFEKVVQPELSPTVNTSGSTSENVYNVAHMATSTEQLQTNTVETLTEECTNIDGKNEFINSEFYIDESIPSIYGYDDNCHDDRIYKTNYSTKGRQKSVLEIRTINVMSSTYPNQNIHSKNNMIINFDTKESMETMFSLLQENLGTTRLEVERLRSVLKSMSKVSTDCITLARANLQKITSEQRNFQMDFRSEFQNISEKWQLVRMQYESREHDIQEMTTKYQTEVHSLKAEIQQKEDKIRDLENDLQQKDVHWSTKVSQLETNYADLQQRYQQLEIQLDIINCSLKDANSEKMRALEELQNSLTHKHKTEIESLRCRYKLMTSMERSPSDTSLERIGKPLDAGEESNIIQMRKAFMVEKEEAIKEAVNYERSFWEAKKKCKCMSECDENTAATESSCVESTLKQEIDNLNREKYRIEEQLNMEKSRRVEMEQSFADLNRSAMEGSTLRRSKSSGSNHRYIVLETCSKGDIVFVVWNARHCQFMVVQDSVYLYFVHCDSLSALNLKIPGSGEPEIPSPFFALGRVVHKEYCQARKHENRYRVSRGTRFYRIKLEPLSRAESKWANRRERVESTSSSASTNRSPSQNEASDQALANINVSRQLQSDVVDAPCSSSGLKERTISVTSVTEEDDEPVSLLSDRCRYISVSEEEETNRSVITEQPTSSYFVSMDNASASSSMTCTTPVNVATSSVITVSRSPKPIQILANIGNCSLEKDTDDSDEYRSLEAKDEHEFPISQE